jgi:hypothetical protein
LSSLNQLRNELKNDPLGESMNLAAHSASTMLQRSPIGQLRPDKAAEAAFRWRMDFGAKVEEHRNDPEALRALITPGAKEYVLSPERVASYLPLSAAAASAGDAEVLKKKFEAAQAEASKGGGSLPRIGTLLELQKLPAGTYFYNTNTGKLGHKP